MLSGIPNPTPTKRNSTRPKPIFFRPISASANNLVMICAPFSLDQPGSSVSLPGEFRLHLLGYFSRDQFAPGEAAAIDILADALRVRKITVRDRLTLGAAELFRKPLRQSIAAVHTPVELVDLLIEGISTHRHDRQQPDHPQRTVFD